MIRAEQGAYWVSASKAPTPVSRLKAAVDTGSLRLAAFAKTGHLESMGSNVL